MTSSLSRYLQAPSWIEKLRPYQPWIQYGIFLQALVATLGSLYYSTFGDPVANIIAGNLLPIGMGLTPCSLCWFARILMYPIVPLSTVGILKNDKRFTDYVLPLSIMGIFLDTYHYSLQKTKFDLHIGCSVENPCNALQVQYFGFITIPLLALIAFIVITVLAVLNFWLNQEKTIPQKLKSASVTVVKKAQQTLKKAKSKTKPKRRR